MRELGGVIVRDLSFYAFNDYVGRVARLLKEGGGLDCMLDGISLSPGSILVPMRVVEKRGLVVNLGALALLAAENGRRSGQDVGEYEKIYGECYDALRLF